MKKIICTTMLIFVSGCGTFLPKTVWYKPDVTLEKSYQDSCECMYDANKAYGNALHLYNQCMKVRGYKVLEGYITTAEQAQEKLPQGIKFRRADDMAMIYVTGW